MNSTRPGQKISLVKSKFQGKAFLIPTCVTMVGIFCGFLAVISAFNGKFEYATRCVLLAFILDGLDGQVARKLNATSEFGKEFDSLSDLVSFGVAPAILMYSWAFQSSFDEFGVLISFLYVACGATRLARFNVGATEKPSKYFEGLPIPAAAMGVIAIIYYHPIAPNSDFFAVAALAYTAALSLLMVSTFPYFSLKQLNFNQRLTRSFVALLAVAVALVWYSPKNVIVLGMLGYIASAPLMWVKGKVTKTKEKAD